MDLHRLIVVGVVLVVRNMVVALGAGCTGKDVRERAVLAQARDKRLHFPEFSN